MERLTTTSNKGGVALTFDLDITCDKSEIMKILKLAEKLKEYEDLEEQCCKENSWGLKMLTEKWKGFIEDIQELYEYRKAEEQGKLLKLPCAVGDTVYTLNPLPSGKTVLAETTADAFFCVLCTLEGRFGKTVFATREEAESALKELQMSEGN